MTDSIHRFRLRLHRPKLGRWAARGAFAATTPVVCEHPGDRGIQVSPDPARPAMVGGEQPTGARLRGGERWRRSFDRWQVGRRTAVLTLLAGCTSASAPGPSGPAAPPDFFTGRHSFSCTPTSVREQPTVVVYGATVTSVGTPTSE